MAQVNVLVAGLARTLSVLVRGFTHPGTRAHGHMTDRADHEDHL
jgi:hypothetical protein